MSKRERDRIGNERLVSHKQFQCSTALEYDLLIRRFHFTRPTHESDRRATVIMPGNNGSFIVMRVPIGKTIELDVDVTRLGLPKELPANASHIVYIGLRNVLVDAHARVPKSDPDCVAKSRTLAERKLDALYGGQIRTFSTPRATDPIASEIRRLATNIVQKMHAAALAKASAKDRLAQLRLLVTAYVAEHEKELRPLAERRLRELDELTESSTADEPSVQSTTKQSKKSKRSGAA